MANGYLQGKVSAPPFVFLFKKNSFSERFVVNISYQYNEHLPGSSNLLATGCQSLWQSAAIGVVRAFTTGDKTSYPCGAQSVLTSVQRRE